MEKVEKRWKDTSIRSECRKELTTFMLMLMPKFVKCGCLLLLQALLLQLLLPARNVPS